MKTKREVLIHFAKFGNCKALKCLSCPYYSNSDKYRCRQFTFEETLKRIGAKALLRMFPEKRECDRSKIITCTTSYQAVVGMRGYFADNISALIFQFEQRHPTECLKGIRDESHSCRFLSNNGVYYSLFYPIDEVEE